MLPAKKDNYGVDSCAIIAINSSTPTTLVIAESTGRLHHCIITEDENGQWGIYVVETIGLELGLTIDVKERGYVCPVFLKQDPTNESRYFAYHNAGLHAVTIKFLTALATFIGDGEDADENKENAAPGTFELTESSQAEYLVCTKMSGVDKANVVLGLAFLQSPSVMVLYLNSGQVVSLDLINNSGVLDQYLAKPQINSTGKSSYAVNTSLSDSLKPPTKAASLTQPILNLDKTTKLGPIQNLGMLEQVLATFKEHYFQRLTTVRQELERRVKLLTGTKNQQITAIRNLQAECELIRDNAENLAVKYEDICEKQQEYSQRAQEVMRLANLHLPRNSGSEKEFIDKIAEINLRTKTLGTQLVSVNAKMEQFRQHGEHQGKAKQPAIVLPAKREQLILEILGDATKQIEQQMSQVKRLLQIVKTSDI